MTPDEKVVYLWVVGYLEHFYSKGLGRMGHIKVDNQDIYTEVTRAEHNTEILTVLFMKGYLCYSNGWVEVNKNPVDIIRARKK